MTTSKSGVKGGRRVFGVMVDSDVMKKGVDLVALLPKTPTRRLRGT
jgi:hypothetical protein